MTKTVATVIATASMLAIIGVAHAQTSAEQASAAPAHPGGHQWTTWRQLLRDCAQRIFK